MGIEAPISKYKKTNLKLYIAICAVAAAIFAYDGFLSKYKWSGRYNFYKENVLDNDGKPNPTMNFNRKSPPFFIAGAVLFGIYLYFVKDKKLIAHENELIFSDKNKIPYDSIQKIDKTYFKKKGFFVITYKDESGKEMDKKLNDRTYDNLTPVLDHLVTKIT